MIKVSHIKTNDEFANLRQVWTSLLKQCPADDAFLTWEWLYTWWEHFGSAYRLWLLAAWEGNELVGVAPLMLGQKRISGLTWKFLYSLGMPEADVRGFITRGNDPQISNAFYNYLLQHAKDWDVLELHEVSPKAIDLQALSDRFSRAGFAIRTYSTVHYYLPTDGDWKAFHAKLSRNLRDDIRKKIHRMEKQAKLEFEQCTGNQVLPEHIQWIFQITEQWRYPDLYASPEAKPFHLDLADRMGEQGWARIYFVSWDNQPIAFDYGFFYNQRFEDWRSGFENKYFQYSPGKALLFHLIETSFQDGLKEIDFLCGTEDYKKQWMVEERTFHNIFVVRNNPLLRLKLVWLPHWKVSIRRWLELSPLTRKWLERYDQHKK
jgi:CelD/BcsL family acetyltransferase involved in cellulose biosynthesis